jgi:hypothetical protein
MEQDKNKFQVKDLMILLMDIHDIRNELRFKIHYDDINEFIIGLNYIGIKCYLSKEDFKNFNEKKPGTVEFFDDYIQITINQNVFFAHCGDSEYPKETVEIIKKIWHSTINCTPISNLYIDEISIGDIFKYNNKFYVCRIGSGCTKCSFNDSINYRCTCEDGILTNCATALRHDNKPVYYVEIDNPTLNGDNNQKYIDLDKKNIVGEGNPIVKEENNQQKNLVDIDKFLSKINDFEKEREKLCVLKEKFANLDKRPISKINSITISYRPTEYTVNEREHKIELTNGLIDEKLLREITDFAVQKMKEYENSLENEIKNIILN